MNVINEFLLNIMDALGINANLAMLILILVLGAGFTVIIVAGMRVRQNMHADHFDVLDSTHSHALKISIKALEHATYTRGLLDGMMGNGSTIKINEDCEKQD